MKIAVLSSRLPTTLDKGDKLRLHHQLKYLHQRHEIKLIALHDQAITTEDKETLKSLCSSYELYEISSSDSMRGVVAALWNSKPAQVGYFYKSSIRKKLQSSIVNFKPDVVYCQLIRMASYVKSMPYAKCLDYMDCMSEGMLNRAADANWLEAQLFTKEASLCRSYEHEIYKYFNTHTIISQKDRDQLPILSKQAVRVIPNGIDTVFFDPQLVNTAPSYDFGFVGNLGYKPNEQAVRRLWDAYVQRYGKKDGPTVGIFGARPTKWMDQIQHPKWTIVGWVDDIRTAYASIRVFLAPLFSGSGLQNKMLEAMSMQNACVTTAMVNESIHAEPTKHLYICDSMDDCFIKAEFLMKSADERKRMGFAARKFVEARFIWDQINEQLDQLLIETKQKNESKRNGSRRT